MTSGKIEHLTHRIYSSLVNYGASFMKMWEENYPDITGFYCYRQINTNHHLSLRRKQLEFLNILPVFTRNERYDIIRLIVTCKHRIIIIWQCHCLLSSHRTYLSCSPPLWFAVHCFCSVHCTQCIVQYYALWKAVVCDHPRRFYLTL